MAQFPLSKLVSGDSENHLSDEARQRVVAAHFEAEKIQTSALALAQIRCRAEGVPEAGLSKYLEVGQAFIDLTEARMEAARAVLRVEADEYRKLGLPLPEFRQIMKERIEAAANSLDLSGLQSEVLVLEFVWLGHRNREDNCGARGDRESEVSRSGRSIESNAGADRILEYKKMNCLTFTAFAEKAHIEEKTLRRLVKTGTATGQIWAEVAKAMGVTTMDLLR
jgi:hypothetical protein